MRINKLLSNYGYCSRKEVNELIQQKRIMVNGELCTPGQWVEEVDDILLDNKRIEKQEKVYILFNKPKGITCTAAEEVENNIIDYVNYPQYIFPVGRLDKESEGLIIMTNDGDFANEIISSDNLHEKEYLVTVNKEITNEFIEALGNGVEILGTLTRKCKVLLVDKYTFRIVLTQGLNRQIRRMTKKFGYDVVKLVRIRILNLTIEGINEGKWRNISSKEIQELWKDEI